MSSRRRGPVPPRLYRPVKGNLLLVEVVPQHRVSLGSGSLVRRRSSDDYGIFNRNGREPSVESKLEKHRRIEGLNLFSTTHRLVHGDARSLTTVGDESVHLVVTSPPYFDLIEYPGADGQLGNLGEYARFLDELDRVWAECYRVLIPGGRMCIVVGDVCRSRKRHGQHEVLPLHADLLLRLRKVGYESLATVFWLKIANAATEAGGRGVALGKPYEPNGVVKNDVEFILRVKKPGPYRTPTPLQRTGSIIPRREYDAAMRQVWSDVPGAARRAGHPAPYPVAIAERLIRMSSYVEDTVLDPFSGTGTTTVAAMTLYRNSIAYDIEEEYVALALRRIGTPPFHTEVTRTKAPTRAASTPRGRR